MTGRRDRQALNPRAVIFHFPYYLNRWNRLPGTKNSKIKNFCQNVFRVYEEEFLLVILSSLVETTENKVVVPGCCCSRMWKYKQFLLKFSILVL